MAKRNYSNIAIQTTLQSSINPTDSSLQVASAVGWPSAPFILVLERDTGDEELVLVGNKSGTTFSSLTRGFGGTSGVAHSGGAVVELAITAEDLALIWDHVHTGAGGDDTAKVTHANLLGIGVDDHHSEAHTVASHSDTDATGPELDTLTDGSIADSLHKHDHGAILGLTDDDHTQYLKEKASGGLAAEVPEHTHLSAAQGGVLAAPSILRGERITSGQTAVIENPTAIIFNSLVYENDPYNKMSLNTSTGVVSLGSGVYIITGGVVFEDTVQAAPVGIFISASDGQIAYNEAPSMNFHPESNRGLALGVSMTARFTSSVTFSVLVISDGLNLPIDNNRGTFVGVTYLGPA